MKISELIAITDCFPLEAMADLERICQEMRDGKFRSGTIELGVSNGKIVGIKKIEHKRYDK